MKNPDCGNNDLDYKDDYKDDDDSDDRLERVVWGGQNVTGIYIAPNLSPIENPMLHGMEEL